MIYTSYLANLKNIPDNDNTVRIFITRWKPRNTISMDSYKMIWRPNLAPSELLLAKYKDGTISWNVLRETFLSETKTNKLLKDGLQEVIELSKDKDVFLICYEKDATTCHRSILREIFINNNIECEEFKND